MPNIGASINSLLDKLALSSSATEIDWQELEETKERLARMRFKLKRADYSWSDSGDDLCRPSTDFASDSKFFSAFRRARLDAAQKWLHHSDQTDCAPETQGEAVNKLPSVAEPQFESFAPPMSFDPLIIPGVVFDANPENFDKH